MERNTIITLRKKGKSLRAISRMTGISRKAVTRYWDDYVRQTGLLESGEDRQSAQERIIEGPRKTRGGQGDGSLVPARHRNLHPSSAQSN